MEELSRKEVWARAWRETKPVFGPSAQARIRLLIWPVAIAASSLLYNWNDQILERVRDVAWSTGIGSLVVLLGFLLWNRLKAPILLDAERQVAKERARADAAEAKAASPPKKSPVERSLEMLPARMRDMRAERLAQEPARAQERARRKAQVENLKRAAINAYERSVEVLAGRDLESTARTAITDLRIEQRAFGSDDLGDIYAPLERLVADLTSALDNKDAAPLTAATKARDEAVAGLSVWLDRMRI